MLTRSILLIAFLSILGTGCYHATIDTGLTPSTETIEKPWASAWVYGLVAPDPISTQAKCKHGVAKVETHLSFVNQLVGIITLGIYTPMNIKVTCAAQNTSMNEGSFPDMVVDETASAEEHEYAFTQAAELAVKSGKPVYVKY